MAADLVPPREPEPTDWLLPDARTLPRRLDGVDLVALGAEVDPATLLAGYRNGVFPMHLEEGALGWWSPDPRGVLPAGALRVSRSLRQACRRAAVTVDRDFDAVLRACAAPERSGQWISADFVAAYRELHARGFAHSVEVWGPAGELSGGLFGVSVGGLFAGESMVSLGRDASKVALVALVAVLDEGPPGWLLDVQWCTRHLAGLGAVEVPRRRYVALLDEALGRPAPDGLRPRTVTLP